MQFVTLQNNIEVEIYLAGKLLDFLLVEKFKDKSIAAERQTLNLVYCEDIGRLVYISLV